MIPGQPHVIIHRARLGTSVFFDAADGEFYVNILRDAARDATVALHGYALVPGEVRLLASPGNLTGLAKLMQATGRRYVPHFNRKYGCTGTPWEGRFRSAVIDIDSQFLSCLRFVEGAADSDGQNPATGLLLTLPSSAAHHRGSAVDSMISDHPAYWVIGNTPFERQAAYRRFLDQPVSSSETAVILRAALNGWALGSEAFAASVGKSCGRRSQRASSGRPIKLLPSDVTVLSLIK